MSAPPSTRWPENECPYHPRHAALGDERGFSGDRPRPLYARRIGGARRCRGAAPPCARKHRFCDRRGSRHRGRADRRHRRADHALPRAADDRKAEACDRSRPGQRVYRLPAVGRVLGQDVGGQRQQPARPQRSLLHGPRVRPGRSRGAGRQAVPRAQQMAAEPARLSRLPAALLGRDGGVFAKPPAGVRDGARPAARLFRRWIPRCAMRAAAVAFSADALRR
jgi:hypothetical protein